MKRTNSQQGSASTILLLAVLVIVVMFAATLSRSATTAVTTESSRYARDRAAQAAQTALVDGDAWMEGEVCPAIRDILTQASHDKASFSGPNLMGLSFPSYSKRFPMRGTGATADDYADVTATVSLAGPPIARSFSGVTAGASPVRTEEYRYIVSMVSEGHAAGDAVVRYEHTSTVVVEIQVGPTS